MCRLTILNIYFLFSLNFNIENLWKNVWEWKRNRHQKQTGHSHWKLLRSNFFSCSLIYEEKINTLGNLKEENTQFVV